MANRAICESLACLCSIGVKRKIILRPKTEPQREDVQNTHKGSKGKCTWRTSPLGPSRKSAFEAITLTFTCTPTNLYPIGGHNLTILRISIGSSLKWKGYDRGMPPLQKPNCSSSFLSEFISSHARFSYLESAFVNTVISKWWDTNMVTLLKTSLGASNFVWFRSDSDLLSPKLDFQSENIRSVRLERTPGIFHSLVSLL